MFELPGKTQKGLLQTISRSFGNDAPSCSAMYCQAPAVAQSLSSSSILENCRCRINPDTAGHEALIHASLVVRLSLDRHYPQKPPSVAFESFSGVGDEEKEVLADLVVSSITSRVCMRLSAS